MQHHVTYFPVATQRQLAVNRARIAGRPYAHYFDSALYLPESTLPALAAPIPVAQALSPTAASLNTLLDPGYHDAETGYCELPDGSGYTASLVQFPGVTGEMFRWWFWWHAVEPERYTLWYPHNHVSVRPRDPARLLQPGLRHEERYIGTTHDVDEYIGADLLRIAIEFVAPAELGLDTARFAAAGIVGHACARVRLRRSGVLAATMVHLARATADGFELRSRYFLAHAPDLALGRLRLPLEPMATWLGVKSQLAGARMAYEQLLHDQIEFHHLASFLAPIYAEFGSEDGAAR